jgi:UDP-2-acetamido-3-amino-2,3-dideoxy-glucuronate N-acetyltransferase
MNVLETFEQLPPFTERVAVIGCGNWGKNLVRNFYNLGALHRVCDLSDQVLAPLQQQYPTVHFSTSFESVFSDPLVTGVVIATPSFTHYELGKQALLSGKHVYIEKPIATTTQETRELVALSKSLGKVLMVGHLLLYHPAITRLKQLIGQGKLGKVKSISSSRLNTNLRRSDRSVLWDLAPHDVSILNYLVGHPPHSIVASIGYQDEKDQLVDDACIDFMFPGNIAGRVHVSWVYPVKHVQLVVRGSEQTAFIDDTLNTGKLKLYSTNPTDPIIDQSLEAYLDIEPLRMECQHFINCIRYGYNPKSDGDNGYSVVEIIEQAQSKMQRIKI